MTPTFKPLTLEEIDSLILYYSQDGESVMAREVTEVLKWLETCRLALRVVDAANVFLQKDSGKFSYLELESSLKPFRQSESEGGKNG